MRLKDVATLHVKNKVKKNQPSGSSLLVVNYSDPLLLINIIRKLTVE